ncbi:MAG: DUF3168 domain-containing protein [Muribaculaceae bacterium]|nr:DUF3168 domain-containing protein [Muribaculaceae bacterium]
MTSLSAGNIIYDILANDTAVKAIVTKVFPVVTDKAELPYVAYRREHLTHNAAKNRRGADELVVMVNCYAETYSDSVELGEAVRAALDYSRGKYGDIEMRSCTLTDSSETYAEDAYIQQLEFTIRIN